MSVRKVTHGYLVPEHQADETGSQAAPVQNTWYTALDVKNTRLYMVAFRVRVADETLEVKVTIDGNVAVGTQAATTDTWYFLEKAPYEQIYAVSTSSTLLGKYTSFEGHSVKVEIRKTTALGAGALNWNITYAKW